MTTEKRNLITPDEIIGVQLECKNCRAKIIIEVSDERPIPRLCAHCGDPWVVGKSTNLHIEFFQAVNDFRSAMKQIAKGVNNVHCILALEIKPDID